VCFSVLCVFTNNCSTLPFLQPIILLQEQSALVLMYHAYFPSTITASWMELLDEQTEFPAARPIVLQGINIPEPRDVAMFTKPNTPGMKYGGISRTTAPYSDLHYEISDQLQPLIRDALQYYSHVSTIPTDLNCLLLNRYLDGRDSMGLHSDHYLAMGQHPLIASLSLGASRTFVLKNPTMGTTVETVMHNGTVVLMLGMHAQQHWKHGVPKAPNTTGVRWNLSFRFHHDFQTLASLTAFKDKNKYSIAKSCKKFFKI
jgi:alkylated DNA repair dioxygenase AlkB